MAIWLPLVLAGLVVGSQFVTNPEDLGKRFARAQKLLATGDFAGAQRIYEGVLAVQDGALMRASAVRVASRRSCGGRRLRWPIRWRPIRCGD